MKKFWNVIRIVVFVIVCAFVFLTMTACPPLEPPRPMNGTWTVDCTSGSGPDFTVTLSYIGDMVMVYTIQVYQGTVNIGGNDYTVGGMYVADLNTAGFIMNRVTDTTGDSFQLTGTISGSTITGTYTPYDSSTNGTLYDGWGTGNFTATK